MNLETYNRQQFAKRLAFILGSDKVSDDYKDAIESVLCEACNEANLAAYSPEIIELSYSVLCDQLNPKYFDVINTAVAAIVGSIERGDEKLAGEMNHLRVRFDEAENPNLDAETKIFADKLLKADQKEHLELATYFTSEMHKAIEGRICTNERMIALYPIFREINLEMDEINKREDSEQIEYEKAQDETPEEKPLLDLSEQPENLNILAADLSKVMKNPLLPTRIYDCIHEQLTTVGADTDGAEWILANLKGEDS